MPDLYQSQLEHREMANQQERVKCRRNSWANLITRVGKANIFAGFNRDALDRISSENVSTGTPQPMDMQTEARIDDFVGSYRSLPFPVRAKLENWAIDQEELLLQPSRKSRAIISSGGRGKAMYHGLEVDVRVLQASSATLTDSSDHNEIQALAQMRHPNIVGFLGTCAFGQLLLIVTESMSLGTLETLVRDNKAKCPSWRPAKAETLAWSLGLVRAVNYMHQSDPRIVHRGLCPAVLLMAPGGVLKVSGFASCCRAGGSLCAPASADHPLDCITVSSPHAPDSCAPDGAPRAASPYAAPELGGAGPAGGRRDSDPAVDIFAVGMLMRFMRAGALPHARPRLAPAPPSHAPAAPQPQPCARPHSKESKPPAAAQLGWPKYTAAAARAAAEDPADRPTADELTGVLEGLQAGLGRRPGARGCCAS